MLKALSQLQCPSCVFFARSPPVRALASSVDGSAEGSQLSGLLGGGAEARALDPWDVPMGLCLVPVPLLCFRLRVMETANPGLKL